MKKFTAGLGFIFIFLFLAALPARSQQTGSISGRVTTEDGASLPGVIVEAAADILPQPRTTVTDVEGRYRFPALPPGEYELTFTLDGFKTLRLQVPVRLDQNQTANATMQLDTVTEEVNVVAELPTIDTTSSEIKTAIDNDTIDSLPVGQEYRDLVKLVPGVQYTEDAVRGPSAGGNGQDNVYLFDGVNVGLPLFGTLSADPSSYDIAQFSIIKGGAKAIDFNRSGGFTINSVSRSGTNRFKGRAGFQIQTESMTGDRKTNSDAQFKEDRDWTEASIGGPIVPSNLTFYTSYYRPTTSRNNRSNLYGSVPGSDSVRDEYFGKLSWTPSDSILLQGSYRDSQLDQSGFGVSGEDTAGSASIGNDSSLEISILEGSWVLNEKSFVGFKFTDFANKTSSRPDTVFGFETRGDGSVMLDVNNLDQQGLFLVPQPVAGQDAYNAFIAPLINRYGFSQNGAPTGGGIVGGGSTINDQDFFRSSWQVGYDTLLGNNHELHIGYQYSKDEEDLSRRSNGWGVISVIGGRDTTADGQPIFYEARVEQQGLTDLANSASPVIHSEFESQSIEINDIISYENWTFNVGVLLSNDKLYGQGLRENSSNVSGFELAPGNRYKMYEVKFDEMIQPRLGLTRSLSDGRASAYASYARYHPAASSLPRAASWARNLQQSIRARFDAQGNLIELDPVSSSSGKFFADDLDPRAIDEYIIGYSRQFGQGWTGKAYGRYRYAYDFWEDTNNNARSAFLAPDGIPQEDYIPNLGAFRNEIGGSSYVIAELDNAFTKFFEASFEADWRGKNAYFKGTYVWSHYYGNFDQDNTTTDNDANAFIGSSFIADGAGRQLWDFRYGNLRGDRRHQIKMFGYYNFRWNGSAGAYAIYQSGEPWEAWNVEVYRNLTGSSSDTSRFAEPAGSRTTSDHYQVDLNYTQHFLFGGRYDFELRGDVFNVTDNQTGYNIQNKVNSAGFGEPRSFFNPRRFQLAVRFSF
jgi:hypothetical protein